MASGYFVWYILEEKLDTEFLKRNLFKDKSGVEDLLNHFIERNWSTENGFNMEDIMELIGLDREEIKRTEKEIIWMFIDYNGQILIFGHYSLYFFSRIN